MSEEDRPLQSIVYIRGSLPENRNETFLAEVRVELEKAKEAKNDHLVRLLLKMEQYLTPLPLNPNTFGMAIEVDTGYEQTGAEIRERAKDFANALNGKHC